MSLKNPREILHRIALATARLNGSDSATDGYMALVAILLILGFGVFALYMIAPKPL